MDTWVIASLSITSISFLVGIGWLVAIYEKLTMRVVELEAQRKYLWNLLDDVSTAGDMFKPEIDEYFKYVNNKADARSNVLVSSDGLNLVETKLGESN